MFRRLRLFDRIGVLVVVAWAAALAWHLADPGGAPADAVAGGAAAAGLEPGDEWQGLYLGQQKAGFLHLHKERLSGAQGWQVHSELRLKLLVLGKQQQLDVDLAAVLDPALLLRSFRVRVQGGSAGELSVRGQVKGKQLQLYFRSEGEERPQTIELKRPPTLELASRPLLARQGLAPGKRLTVEFFDPLSQSSRVLTATVTGEEELTIMGRPVHVFALRQELDGMQLKAWITATGEVVREELPLGLVAVRETEEEARHGTTPPPAATGGPADGGVAVSLRPAADLIDSVSVPLHGDAQLLAGPRVVLRLPGLGLEQPQGKIASRLDLDGGRQTRHGDRLEVQREELSVPPAVAPPLPAEAVAALAPEPLLQSDDPEVREQAVRATAGAGSPQEQVRRLVDWVYGALEQTGVIGVPSALEVLHSRRGDCNEHATLFVALARAAGIPARLLAGLVLLPERGRFFYHAWAEVWLAGRWVEVDPTFDELPASVTRVRMVRGGLDRQVELLQVIGRLQAIEALPPPSETSP